MAKNVPPGEPDDCAPVREKCVSIRKRRRMAVEGCTKDSLAGFGNDAQKKKAYIDHHPRTGIAFSGGGIRSATISLGLTEALAVQGRFYGIDMMSTVSGGGYFGSFLRSLFIGRDEDKGTLEKRGPDSDPYRKSRQQLADAVLLSMPDTQYFRASDKNAFLEKDAIIKNPLWWLRENGRYLAPGGGSDYGFALVYALRNWLTLIFCIMVALVCCFSLIQWLLLHVVMGPVGAQFDMIDLPRGKTPVSPFFPMMGPLLAVGCGIGLAYWTSLGMTPTGDDDPHSPKIIERSWGFGVMVITMTVITILLIAGSLRGYWRPDSDTSIIVAALILILGSASLFSVAVAVYSYWEGAGRQKLAFELRRNLTRVLSVYMMIVLAAFAFCLVDSVALYVRGGDPDDDAFVVTTATSTAIASAFAWLIAKIPGWFEGKSSKFIDLCKRNAPLAALIAGITIAFALAVSADLLVLKVLWIGTAWGIWSTVDIGAFRAFIGVSILLVLLIGSSSQLLNLIGFTPLYASRLTRSYLGASNVFRQKQGDKVRSDVTRGMKGDDLAVDRYMMADVAAPLHLINVTLNRTMRSKNHDTDINKDNDPFMDQRKMSRPRGPIGADDWRPRGRIDSYESELTLRDRKGDRMVIGPAGIRAGAEWLPWEKLVKDSDVVISWHSRGNVELPSVGQFCAISGAAISSAMGRRTSLGMALALTLSNVRLGHWWRHSERGPDIIHRWWQRLFEFYENLLCELLARYCRDDPNWYLTDGGHSENSGLLSLLERGCEFAVVCDNGEDAEYQFADLEIAVRTARTDLGIEIEVVPKSDFPASFNGIKDCFFNDDAHSWRTQAKSRDGSAFAILLRAKFIAQVKPDGRFDYDRPPAWIIWIKPSLFKGLSADILTYAELNPDFPQQSTGNQFFDEAQWESYRRLGFDIGRTLFKNASTIKDLLPIIRHKIPQRVNPPAQNP